MQHQAQVHQRVNGLAGLRTNYHCARSHQTGPLLRRIGHSSVDVYFAR